MAQLDSPHPWPKQERPELEGKQKLKPQEPGPDRHCQLLITLVAGTGCSVNTAISLTPHAPVYLAHAIYALLAAPAARRNRDHLWSVLCFPLI